MGLISLSQVPLKMSWNLTLHPAPGTLDFDTTFHSFREQTRHCGGKGTGDGDVCPGDPSVLGSKGQGRPGEAGGSWPRSLRPPRPFLRDSQEFKEKIENRFFSVDRLSSLLKMMVCA